MTAAYHAHQITKLTAELAGATDAMEIEAIEWALGKHRVALRAFGIFAV